MVRLIADTIPVLRVGKLVESGPVKTVFRKLGHDDTRDLIGAISGGAVAAEEAAA